MALIVGGVTVTGTQTLDASKLTGTASAINGSNITNLPAPSTSDVASATAGIALDAVGSYVFAGKTSSQSIGATIAGSSLQKGRVTSGFELDGGSTLSGTWRRMGGDHNTAQAVTLFLRIS